MVGQTTWIITLHSANWRCQAFDRVAHSWLASVFGFNCCTDGFIGFGRASIKWHLPQTNKPCYFTHWSAREFKLGNSLSSVLHAVFFDGFSPVERIPKRKPLLVPPVTAAFINNRLCYCEVRLKTSNGVLLCRRQSLRASWYCSATFDIKMTYHPVSLTAVLILSFHISVGLSNCLFPSVFPTNTLYSYLFPHTCHMPRPSHSSRFHDPCNAWWAVQSMKLLIM